jgi:hypothetical protein
MKGRDGTERRTHHAKNLSIGTSARSSGNPYASTKHDKHQLPGKRQSGELHVEHDGQYKQHDKHELPSKRQSGELHIEYLRYYDEQLKRRGSGRASARNLSIGTGSRCRDWQFDSQA